MALTSLVLGFKRRVLQKSSTLLTLPHPLSKWHLILPVLHVVWASHSMVMSKVVTILA